jgi:hypothetical protein
MILELDCLWWLGAISGATALALAAILCFATIVTSLAASLSFTVILAFTGVLGWLVCHIHVADAGNGRIRGS